MTFYHLNQYVRYILSIVLFLVSGIIGWSLSQSQGAATVIWPAAGVGVLAWLIWREIGLAGIFTGALIFFTTVQFLDSDNDFIGEMSILGIFVAALSTTFQSWITGYLIEKQIGFPIEFPRLTTAIKLIIVSALTSLITPTVVLLQASFPNFELLVIQQWYWWWAGCMIGVVLVLPLGFYIVPDKPQWLPSFKTVIGPMVIIWGFTFILYGIVLQVQSRSNGTLFIEQSKSIASVLGNTVNTYEDTLRAFERFVVSNPNFDVAEFQQFGKPMIDNIPGLIGFTLSLPVKNSEIPLFIDEQSERWGDNRVGNEIIGSKNNNPDTISYLISDYTRAKDLGVEIGFNESLDPVRSLAIRRSIQNRNLTVASWVTDNQDLIQLYAPIYSSSSVEPAAIVSAVLKIKPVLANIFSIQADIPRQTILMQSGISDHNHIIYSSETINGATRAIEKLKFNWKGVFARSEITIGSELWELYQFTNKPIVYDQFLLSSVIAGGFMFSGILCWFVLVLAGNAKNISLQVEQKTHELQISSDLMEASQHIARLGSWEWFPDTDVHHWSKTFYSLLGIPETAAPSPELFLSQVRREELEATERLIKDWQNEKQLGSKHQCRIRSINGKKLHLHLYCDWVKNPDGSNRFLSVVAQDVTEMVESQKQLLIAAATFETQDAILITDGEGRVQRINQAYSLLHGYELDDLKKNENGFGFLEGAESKFDSIIMALNNSGAWTGELRCKNKAGFTFPSRVSISSVENSKNEITNYVINVNDISEQKEAQDRIKQLAYFDALTGLPNRESFYLQSSKLLYDMAEDKRFGALLFLDLDNFKVLNDTLGHKTGDALINEVAKRFKFVLTENDVLARFGGDEFLLMLGRSAPYQEDIRGIASTIADKLLFSMTSPFWVGGHSFTITASIGISIIEEGHVDVESLIIQADLAMYFAKMDGRNRFRYYQSEMGQSAKDKFRIEDNIRRALAEKAFEVYYQPQVNERNEIVGLESLIRWFDPEEGLISPDKFIPLAEESSLIVDIESYVFEMVCMDISHWKSTNKEVVQVAINISPVHFIQSGFLNQIDDLLDQYGIDPGLICIEITERVLAEDAGLMRQRIESLRQREIDVSIDDFGTGYSSLSYLKQLPISEIKIAKEFIQDVPHDRKDVALVRTISNLAESLNLRVIAEGVETIDQFEFLTAEGCRRFQGFYFHKPMAKKDVTKLLRNKYAQVM